MRIGRRLCRTKGLAWMAFLGVCLALPCLPARAEENGAANPQAVLADMEDGEYAIEVKLEGGTGKTTISSPAGMYVMDGHAYARIEWSSSHYDYMLVDGEKYLPIQEEGCSTFEIPIRVFDEPMAVVADTTAMSVPHEIEYQITFLSDGIMSKTETPQAAAQRMVYMVFVIIAICGLVSFVSKKRRKSVR